MNKVDRLITIFVIILFAIFLASTKFKEIKLLKEQIKTCNYQKELKK